MKSFVFTAGLLLITGAGSSAAETHLGGGPSIGVAQPTIAEGGVKFVSTGDEAAAVPIDDAIGVKPDSDDVEPGAMSSPDASEPQLYRTWRIGGPEG